MAGMVITRPPLDANDQSDEDDEVYSRLSNSMSMTMAIDCADLGLDLDEDSIRNFRVSDDKLLNKSKHSQNKRIEVVEPNAPVQLSGRKKESKLIELAKKTRNLTVAFERERSTNVALKKTIQDLEEALKRSENHLPPLDSMIYKEEINQLKDKVSYLNKKLDEERGQNKALRQEVKNYQKVFLQELGEEAPPVSKLLESSTGWKGRAQQIALLKAKIKELTAKVTNSAKRNSQQESDNIFDERHRQTIKSIENSKFAVLHKTALELELAKSETSELKAKYEASAGRCRYLEREVKDLRAKLHILLQKESKDTMLIEALKERFEKNKT
ncbi:Coiled-coil domain-containing protein 13 [Chytridiales sp. JEL 0842]|nr:Coiled-coil domain-containing protein 13 [Chytridiales sp. JEL 0842]